MDLTATHVFTGPLTKMSVVLDDQVSYTLTLGDQPLSLNPLLGRKLSLSFIGDIRCCHCQRKTRKSFGQGYCYPCFRKLPQCDSCILSPEKCHHHLGTCRDPDWGERFCMSDHIVYLANSSGIKVGITRISQMPVRWIDQGATQALPILRVATRYQSGLMEQLFKGFVSDRTNWRTMLKGVASPVDLTREASELLDQTKAQREQLSQQLGLQAIQTLENPRVLTINYPVVCYPKKVTALSLDKTPVIEGVLQGIKGQYLLLDTGVFNVRRHTAYQVQLAVH